MQYTLDTLKTAIKDEVEDQGSAFAGNLNRMIQSAEDAAIVDLDLEIFNGSDVATFTIGLQSLSIPSGFLKVKGLTYLSGTERIQMEERSYEYCLDYSPDTTDVDAPLFWAPFDSTTVFIAPPPDVAYVGTVRGPKRPNSLVTDVNGTWLSLNAGDLLFRRALMEAEKFIKADERLPMRATDYMDELGRKHRELSHLRNHEFVLDTPPQPAAKE